jgi:N-formylglutamate amidohydrolase
MDYLNSFNKVFNKKHKGYFMTREYRTPGPLPALKILTVELWFIGYRNKRKELVEKFEYKGSILDTMISQVYQDLHGKVLMYLFEEITTLFLKYGEAK